MQNYLPYLFGALALILLWILYILTVDKSMRNPWKLVEGADGRPSTSKLQWFLWTVVIIFSYTVIYSARAMKGHFEPITDIPANLLIAMGLSITTTTAAKGITVAYVARGRVVKTKASNRTDSPRGSIFQDDEGFPDLSKTQMVAWTLIANSIYLITIVHQVRTDLPELPDIAPALMVLMGLGQGAYLGKKLITVSVPRLTILSPSSGKPGDKIEIHGMSLGNRESGQLLIDGYSFGDAVTDWQDTLIRFTFPAKRPDGKDWPPGQKVSIGVVVNGKESANTLPFTVLAP